LVRVPIDDDSWTTLYCGRLSQPFQFSIGSPAGGDLDVSGLAPGDPYPVPIEPAEEYRFRQRSGGVIAKSAFENDDMMWTLR
jgi:hypothetical protein